MGERTNLVAKYDGVRLRFVFSNKNFTTSSASVVVRSAQAFSFGARKFAAACSLEGAKLVFTCWMKGNVGVMTRKTKATEAEMSTQCFLAVENMIRRRI